MGILVAAIRGDLDTMWLGDSKAGERYATTSPDIQSPPSYQDRQIENLEHEEVDDDMNDNTENEDQNCSRETPAPDNLISTPDKNKLLKVKKNPIFVIHYIEFY